MSFSQYQDQDGAVQSADRIPWDPNCSIFPSRKDLPHIPGAPKDAAWVWGENDQIGRLNLLTPTRVKDAASSEIKTGQMIRLDLPLGVPNPPAFGRAGFVHKIKPLQENLIYDDLYESLNTQSGTQWDGFRHFSHLSSGLFYNSTTATDITGSTPTLNNSIHHWSATHGGIAGRCLLLDFYTYAQTHGLTYDPYQGSAISFTDLQACGHSQGINILPVSQGGDISVGTTLMIRSGFVARYNQMSPENRADILQNEKTEYAGLKQEAAMLDWLHDCYFAAVGGDAPAFERWPPQEEYFLHEYVLALWGMPIGEMWDLERVAALCRQLGRWTFFMTSAPANVEGGVSSQANAMAIF
ncbi:hypothetical protein BO79DRAFT_278626 [Aspergillus costaricaensis CBS 115574]|uniref:Uncharacterized protein n=1 Tax=Aspergillus costaricaensis CBS 115574 TaxID=1448317 RepID=A0ACD1IMX5_9EURO|nr:hypothetical protein BO79DRAFT_278626 [Aspergillus costaricaensis CBS 115574]RAK91929.1 hypothetical protein BO79DRAFT_278626 [Aspergillus costaricaensis CBS 115574]